MIDTAYRGVDVSSYQGIIDWSAAAADGIRFAMIKATQGRSVSDPALSGFTDSRFIGNVTGASGAGIACGAYHYLTALNEGEAIAEADVFLSAAAPYRDLLPLGLAVDVEDSRLPRDRNALTAIVRMFCRRVSRAGFTIMVYTNPDFLRNRFDVTRDTGLWLALWRDIGRPPASDDYPGLRMWQYGTDTVAGIRGPVDVNFGIRGLLGQQAAKIDYAEEVRRRAGLSETTMQYLAGYRWGEDLIRKLYLAMTEQNGQNGTEPKGEEQNR